MGVEVDFLTDHRCAVLQLTVHTRRAPPLQLVSVGVEVLLGLRVCESECE